MRISSPSESSCGRSSFLPFTNVPFLLPLSAIVTFSPAIVIEA